MNQGLPDITVVIVSFNTAAMTADCLQRVARSEGTLRKDVLVIDNDSNDGTAETIQKLFPEVRVVANSENVGFGRANNLAVAGPTGRYVLLLNSDAFVPPEALRKTIAFMDAHPECGISGASLVDDKARPQPSARYWPTPLNSFLICTGLNWLLPWIRPVDDLSWDRRSVRDCDWVPGCYFVVRRDVIDELGLFDPRYFLYYEEVDFCMAVKRAGWKVLCDPSVEVVHIGGASAKGLGAVNPAGRQLEGLRLESEFLFYRKNYGAICTFMALLLDILADLIIVLKNALKLKKDFPFSGHFRHILQVWRIFLATRAGTKPTR